MNTEAYATQAEIYRDQALDVLATVSAPHNDANKIALAQIYLLAAVVSSLLGENAKGPNVAR